MIHGDTVDAETIGIALVYPDLLGTYGDGGNATILAQRLRWRGYKAEVITVSAGQPVPDSCQLYMIGGGEDVPQATAARDLNQQRSVHRAVDRGAAVLAVCAGMQIMGTSFMAGGKEHAGLGLLDCRSISGSGPRAVGELVVQPDPSHDNQPDRNHDNQPDRNHDNQPGPSRDNQPDHSHDNQAHQTQGKGLPTLTGYENHAGVTLLGDEARPSGRVVHGVGNGDGTRTDGAVQGRVYGTYLHGPALARNPALADLLLQWAIGPLDPLDDSEEAELRRERLAAAGEVERPGPLVRLAGALTRTR